MRINYSEIETFLTVLKTKNITKASEILHLSQSTVTQKIKSLEDELGITLFIRNRGVRHLELTTEGQEFVYIAERFKSLLKEAYSIQSRDKTHTLTIACIDSLSIHVFLPLYKEFLCDLNTINLEILTRNSTEIFSLIENREVDIGLTIRKSINKNLKCVPIFEERMVLVLNSNNYYPDNKIFHPHELEQKKELYIDWGIDYEAWHNLWWEPLKNPLITVDTFSLLGVFLENSTSWAILPISIAQRFSKTMDLSIYELSEKPPNRICYKITHQHPLHNRLVSLELFDILLNRLTDNLDF